MFQDPPAKREYALTSPEYAGLANPAKREYALTAPEYSGLANLPEETKESGAKNNKVYPVPAEYSPRVAEEKTDRNYAIPEAYRVASATDNDDTGHVTSQL